MKYTFFSLTVLFLIFLIDTGCKKSENKKPEGFVIRVEGKTIVLDSIVYNMAYVPNSSYSLHSITGYTKSNKSVFYIGFINMNGPALLGTYPVSGNISESRIRDFYLDLYSGSNVLPDVKYYSLESDFVLTIIDKQSTKITGSAKGSVTGGNPVPGGFGPSAYADIRKVPIEIDFDTPFFNP
jgi:hypothetical protein